MRANPVPQEIYKHFKGKVYQILTLAKHSETGEKMVVYQQLYAPYEVYVRPLEMFMSEVDRVKYPDVTQKYRFEKVEYQVSPKVMQYLETDSFQEKLDIVLRLRDNITEDMIYTMAIAHDINLCEGDVMQKYESLCSALQILARYDGKRLR